jgi:hypothetical protein
MQKSQTLCTVNQKNLRTFVFRRTAWNGIKKFLLAPLVGNCFYFLEILLPSTKMPPKSKNLTEAEGIYSRLSMVCCASNGKFTHFFHSLAKKVILEYLQKVGFS